jgi:signal transduction histidine kinase
VVELAVHRHKLATGADARIEIEATPHASQIQKASIYRVIQESLSNAYKHGKATIVNVRVANTPDLTVTITDDGQGFDTTTVVNKGLGLVGMRARVESLRGHFKITSILGRGTTVLARFGDASSMHGADHV